MLKLCHRLVKAFSIALGMESNGLDKLFIAPSFYYWLHYYPEQEGEITEDQFGLAPHTDFSFMTILAQDKVGGLEVKLNDGQWVDAPYIPNTFVLNAGNVLKKMSNDLFNAVPHRVVNRSNKARYSIPFFFDPNMYSIVKVLESCITLENPAKYVPFMYGDDLIERTKGHYGVGKRRK
jgi:isopenicillin N synthase-like dioxygenase